LERSAGMLAEDIQLKKIVTKRGIMLLLSDEIKRVTVFFENQKPFSRFLWNTLQDDQKFNNLSDMDMHAYMHASQPNYFNDLIG
jgi:hypothetical protein